LYYTRIDTFKITVDVYSRQAKLLVIFRTSIIIKNAVNLLRNINISFIYIM